MKIELTHFLTAISIIIAAAALFMSVKRTNKGDSVEAGRIAEKLDNFGRDQKEIKETVKEIRDGVNEMQKDVIELRIRLDRVEDEVFRKEAKNEE